jgi:isoquinoline 1-oxidoreductase subunit alpha
VLTININGGDHEIDAPDDMPLLWALRDLLGLTGTKFGCVACTVHIDGRPVRSGRAIPGWKITTIEAIGATDAGKMIQ